jgi:hypothetical protein
MGDIDSIDPRRGLEKEAMTYWFGADYRVNLKVKTIGPRTNQRNYQTYEMDLNSS